jgi:hypothetical protein
MEPMKLVLKPADIMKFNMGKVRFTPAKFNIGDSSRAEERIITSTGPFTVTWNFANVRKRVLTDYKVIHSASWFMDGDHVLEILALSLSRNLFVLLLHCCLGSKSFRNPNISTID